MSELIDENKALMRRVYEEMWNQAKVEIASQIFDQPAGVERFVSQFLLSFPDLQHTVEDMIADADRAQVAVRFIAKGTHRGPWLGFAPTNRVIKYSGVTWARIVDGRIIEHHTWWDKAGLIEQISHK